MYIIIKNELPLLKICTKYSVNKHHKTCMKKYKKLGEKVKKYFLVDRQWFGNGKA